MYGIEERTYTPENFFRGFFPAVPEHGTVKDGATVRKYAPVAETADGIEEVTAATLDKLVGIAADVPDDGGNVVYYMTGDFNAAAVVLPEGVTLDALKPACRKLSIFLK